MGSHPLKSTLPSIRDRPMKPSLMFTCALGPFMQTLSSKTLLPDTPWKKQLTCFPHTPAQMQTRVSKSQGIDWPLLCQHHQRVFAWRRMGSLRTDLVEEVALDGETRRVARPRGGIARLPIDLAVGHDPCSQRSLLALLEECNPDAGDPRCRRSS